MGFLVPSHSKTMERVPNENPAGAEAFLEDTRNAVLASRAKLTPPQLARLWGISPDKVLNWIRSGELRAINVAERRGGRPRYLIDRADIQAFETRRAVIAIVPVRRRSKPRSTDVIEFF